MSEYCEDCACEPAGVCRHCFEQLESENKRLKRRYRIFFDLVKNNWLDDEEEWDRDFMETYKPEDFEEKLKEQGE